MTSSTCTAPAPTQSPAPSGVGDWLDSSVDLLRGVQVRELTALWWDDLTAVPGPTLIPLARH